MARPCFQAVDHRQQAFGKTLHGKFARLGDFVFSAAAGVLGIGLGAQELVGQLCALGLEGGQFGFGGSEGFDIRRRRGGLSTVFRCGCRGGFRFGGVVIFGHAEPKVGWQKKSVATSWGRRGEIQAPFRKILPLRIVD